MSKAQLDQLETRIREGQPFRRFAPNVEAPTVDSDTGIATFIFNTEEVGRDGHVVLNRGIHTENYDRNPTILFAHDDEQPPIGRAVSIRVGEPASKVDIEFTPRDMYPFGAMIGDMVRGKYLNTCSMSWMPLKWKFSTDKNRAGGVDFIEVDLMEISIVPIPALPGAVATARAAGIDTSPMVEWAEKLLDRTGMLLVPRDELETLRRAARMPAASKSTQEPASAATTMLAAKHKRALARAPKAPVFKRGLYDLSQLCYLVASLGYCHDSAEYEADLEQDNSPVPGMIGEALVTLGEALKAMAIEEVNELLEAHSDAGGEESEVETRALSAEQRAHIAAGKTPRARSWRTGIAMARAGKALSNSNRETLEEADGHQERAMKHHRALGEQHASAGDHMKAIGEQHERATSTLDELGEHLRAAQANPASATDEIGAAAKKQRAVSKALGEATDEHRKMGESHEDAADSHQALGRSLKRAQRCARSVLSQSVASESDDSEESDDVNDSKAERAADRERKARESRAARARELVKQYREPITLD